MNEHGLDYRNSNRPYVRCRFRTDSELAWEALSVGVYIDMEMPKGCALCKIKRRNGTKMVCPLCDEEWDIHDPMSADHRLDNCPLIPVPPHERLGDLSALAERLEDLRKTTAKENPPTDNHGFNNGIMCGIGAAINEVRYYTPTIIPAEEEP